MLLLANTFPGGVQIMLRHHIRLLCIGYASLAVIAVVTQLAVPTTVVAKNGGLVGIEGSLIGINPAAGTLVIRNRRGQSVTIATSAATKIERNDRRATLAAFQLGDRVQAEVPSAD